MCSGFLGADSAWVQGSPRVWTRRYKKTRLSVSFTFLSMVGSAPHLGVAMLIDGTGGGEKTNDLFEATQQSPARGGHQATFLFCCLLLPTTATGSFFFLACLPACW